MTDWQPIETAPKDGTRFLVLNHDGEVWAAKYDQHGRLCFRSHYWRDSYHYTVREIDGQEWRLYDKDWETANSGWQDNWTLWTKGYEFQPTHWLAIPKPPVQP